MENNHKKDWFRILPPAILAIIFSVIVVVASLIELENSGGWSLIGILIFAPIAGILILLDVVIKLIVKHRTLVIWLIELLILAIAYFVWISKFI